MFLTDQIQAPIASEMKKFEDYFRTSLKSSIPLLDIIMNYILRRKGKQMRPMFVILSAKLIGEVNNSTYVAAALIELLHTATLIHDDVVDEAYERRGFFSINALWKSKISVLVGDYLLSKGLLLAIDNNENELLKIVSVAVREMSEGELLQIEKSRKLDISEEQYFDIIRKKTATLIASCTAGGALSAGANELTVSRMRLFGEYTGIAFQIKDDIFDYQSNGLIGKPTGNDIKEKKITLPLIYALRNASDSDRRHILRIVKNSNHNSVKVREVIDYVVSNKGIEYASVKMDEYKYKAIALLGDFPENDAKKSLIDLVNYSTTRKS
ncbi:MAG: polyprenyl synthetase family protein [Bacteroidia bacterium]|nr:polyprenyl synthetase family protein [Bacteroidia bacterium]